VCGGDIYNTYRNLDNSNAARALCSSQHESVVNSEFFYMGERSMEWAVVLGIDMRMRSLICEVVVNLSF
jgi:hypothetical protein